LNKRQEYVGELMKHIKIDSYGSCHHNAVSIALILVARICNFEKNLKCLLQLFVENFPPQILFAALLDKLKHEQKMKIWTLVIT
jgi:hypothetical protein